MTENPSRVLASFASEVTDADIPTAVLARANDFLLDMVASALAGRHSSDTPRVEAVARTLGGQGTATVIGGPALAPIGAVLLNGYQVNGFTICDAYRPLKAHLTPSVVPPALATVEELDSSGSELLRAVVVGLEVMVRVGLGLDYDTYRARGWHAPGVIGPFGAAAAVGHLLGLDASAMSDAFGLAGSQSAGTYAGWGFPQMKFHQARSGVSGLLAGRLAAEGYRASPDALTHPDGGLLNHTYSDGGKPHSITDGLGERWEFLQLSLKRWPVAFQLQAIVIASLALVERAAPDPRRVVQSRVRLSTSVYDEFANLGWDDEFKAHISPRYLLAIILHDRQCWVEQFRSDRYLDPIVGDFAGSVLVERTEDVEGIGAVVDITMDDGSVYSETCTRPAGDPSSPMARSDIVEKFHDARAGIVTDTTATAVLQGLDGLRDLQRVAPLLKLLKGVG